MKQTYLALKLLLILSLFSLNLSYSVMVGNFIKDSFENKDKRVFSTYNWLNNKIVKEKGGPENVQVFPLAIYRQIVNGVSYKIITAVKDEKNKKVNLVDTIIYTGGFDKPSKTQPIVAFQEDLNDEVDISKKTESHIFKSLVGFITEHLISTKTTLENVQSIVFCPHVVNHENFYKIMTHINFEGKSYKRYFIVNFDDKMGGFTILQTIDFPN